MFQFIEQAWLVWSVLGVLLLTAPKGAAAHEGHAAVPSTGATIEGDVLLLSEAAMRAVDVGTESIRLGDLNEEICAQARIELPMRGQARVTSLASGKLVEVFARPGDRVAAGDTLATLASMELEGLAAELAQASSEVNYLNRMASQRRNLAATGAMARKTLLATEASLSQYVARQGVLRDKILALGLSEGEMSEVERSKRPPAALPIVAPIDGVVEHVDGRPGQLVEESEHLFSIVDVDRLYVVAEVLEGDAHLVSVGQPMTFAAAGMENRLDAFVDHIRPRFNVDARAIEVVASVDNRAREIRPGVLGRATLCVATSEQAILCPMSAVVETPDESWVLLRQGEGKFKRQTVELGLRGATYAVAHSGLFPGQKVVTSGTHLLAAMFDARGRTSPLADRRPQSNEPSDAKEHRVRAARAIVELPPSRQAVATSLVEGRVVAIHVGAAEHVDKGQPLAELESQQLRDMQLNLRETQARADWLTEETRRLTPLVQSRISAARDLWEKENELRKAQAEIDSLSRRLELVGAQPGLQTGRLIVEAPLSGQTAEPRVILGQLVHSHDVLFEVVDLSAILVRAVILEEDAGRVAVGQSATVGFAADPQLRLTGQVVRVAPQLVSAEQVLPVWIELPNPDGFLKPGMLARVTIDAQPRIPGLSDSAARP